jgi:flagellar basal-body rod modification protein FlgD
MPDAITGTTSTTAANAASTTATTGATKSNEMDSQMFLKLLVAQLKYQDPMNPADSSQFMAQTAQFTMVEKINDLAKSMTEMLASERQASAGNMIGRYVTATTADGTEVKGTVTKARLEAGGPILTVGDTEVALSAVKEVGQQPPK